MCLILVAAMRVAMEGNSATSALQRVGTDHLKHELDLLLSFGERLEGPPWNVLGAHAAAQRYTAQNQDSATQLKIRTVRSDIDAYGLQTSFLAMGFCNKHLDVLRGLSALAASSAAYLSQVRASRYSYSMDWTLQT